MAKYLFVPDRVKFDESFAIEARNVDEAVEMAEKELCCNTVCSVFEILPFELLYLFQVEFYEGENPRRLGI